jgi:hypothetical protein
MNSFFDRILCDVAQLHHYLWPTIVDDFARENSQAEGAPGGIPQE